MDYEKRKMIDRTRNGLLLLLIGTILGAIPIIGVLGSILVLIGVVLVILGREAFGKTYSRNAIWSVVIYILGLIIIAIFAASFISAIVSAALLTNNPTIIARSITDSFNSFLIGLIIGSAISGIAEVLFTYALQKPAGRLLLWVAYATRLAVTVTVFAIIGPQVSEAVAQAISSGTFNPAPIQMLQTRMQGLQLLGLIPALIYAVAYYLAWSRIKNDEIPQKPDSQPTPGMPFSPVPSS